MIKIKSSKKADTRSCDYANVTLNELHNNSVQHVHDVRKGLDFIEQQLYARGIVHDLDKFTGLVEFHRDFTQGFKTHRWLDNHYLVNRHHLKNHCPDDVNLIDIIEMVVDSVMAGLARTGTYYMLDLPDEVLQMAVSNTAKLIGDHTIIED